MGRLRLAGERIPEELRGRAMAVGERAVPPLIELATDEGLRLEAEGPEFFAPLHAVGLLGELRAAEAVQPLMPLFEWDDDFVDIPLSEALGKIGAPALGPVLALFEDESVGVWTRARAALALEEIGRRNPELRDRVVAKLVEYLGPEHHQASDEGTLTGFIVSHLTTLKAVEAAPAIREAFEQRRVDQWVIDAPYVQRELGPEADLGTVGVEGFRGTSVAAEPARGTKKVGRNDPCPCGSGKKYKKCCLDADEARARSER